MDEKKPQVQFSVVLMLHERSYDHFQITSLLLTCMHHDDGGQTVELHLHFRLGSTHPGYNQC